MMANNKSIMLSKNNKGLREFLNGYNDNGSSSPFLLTLWNQIMPKGSTKTLICV